MTNSLWQRTKHVASTYTGTFIVVMVLNQLLFFGFCLNPICVIAAMPHVLAITVAIGSWLNNESGWGAEQETEATSPTKKIVPKRFPAIGPNSKYSNWRDTWATSIETNRWIPLKTASKIVQDFPPYSNGDTTPDTNIDAERFEKALRAEFDGKNAAFLNKQKERLIQFFFIHRT